MCSNLMAPPVQFLYSRIVGVLMRHEEGALDLASVRVVPSFPEDSVVDVDVVVVDGIIESDGDHLGDCVGLQLSGDLGSVWGAETVGEDALVLVARGSSVGVLVNGWKVEKKYLLSETETESQLVQ